MATSLRGTLLQEQNEINKTRSVSRVSAVEVQDNSSNLPQQKA